MCRKLIYLVSFVLVTGLVLASEANAADPNIVGWWMLNEGSGTIAYDYSVSGNNGTLRGNPQWTTAGKIGGAIEFDGDGDFVEVPGAKNINPKSITLMTWVYFNTVDPALGRQDYVSRSDDYALSLHAGMLDGRIEAIVTSAGGWSYIHGTTVLEPNRWYHTALTYDSSTKNLIVYLDAKEEAETSVSAGLEHRIKGSLTIGTYGNRYLHGRLDDIQIRNKALSAEELNNVYNCLYEEATYPYPLNGGIVGTTDVLLHWNPGYKAANVNGHRVYFDANKAKVTARSGCQINGVSTTDPCYPVTGLARGETYYWAVDEVNDPSVWPGNVWSFQVKLQTAYDPTPTNGAIAVARAIELLEWNAGYGATSHDVYFGTDFDNVNAGTGGTYQGTRTEPNWPVTPSLLESNTTYYWRIDEDDGTTTYKGLVWSFTTGYGLGTITRELYLGITGSAVTDLTSNPGYPDNPGRVDKIKAFDFVGVGVDYGSRTHGWLCPMTTGDYTFWFASDNGGELWLSTDEARDNVRLIARVPGTDLTSHYEWDKFPDDQNSLSYYGSLIALEGGKRYYIMALQKQGANSDNVTVSWQGPGIPPQTVITGGYLSPFESKQAFNPYPANGATGVEVLTPILSWKAGIKANLHKVYLDPDEQKVINRNDCDVNGVTTTDPCYPITSPLQLNTTYYWAVDEVNNPNIWPGNIWRFTTRDFNVVDDFESYNDTSNKIQNTWIKGGGGIVGYPDPNYAERSIIHGGLQSMPFDYNNTKSPYHSDANRTFATPQDWTKLGSYPLKSLTLWFRGYPVSFGGFVESPPGTYKIAASGANIGDVSPTRGGGFHDEFHFGYKAATSATTTTVPGSTTTFTGVKIIAKVDSVGNTGDSKGKAGVMIRDSLDDNSVNGFMCIRRTGADTYGVAFQYRQTAKGGATTQDVNDAGITLPCWVAIILQTGSSYRNVRAYYSKNGTTWVQLGTVQQFPSGTMYLPKPGSAPIYLGLAETPQSNTATRIAKFSSVTLTAGAAGTWKSQDIGIKSNVASPPYVTLQDSDANTATVTHSNPYIVLQNTWQEWDIALSDFGGVNLTKVKKITIGTGNGSSSSGTGTLYFDDIRVYMPRCVANAVAPDFTGSGCVVDNQDLRILTDNWLISDYQVTPATSWDPNNDANLVARYKFDGNYQDSKGTNHGDPCNTTVTIVNDAARGQVASFDGVSAYVSVPRMVQDDFTLSAWIKASTPGAQAGTRAYQGSGLIWSDVAGDYNDFILAVLGTKLAAATGPGTQDLTSIADVVTGQWVHVAMVRTRSTGRVELYINGMLDRASISGGTGSLTANSRILIGANTLDGYYYKGLVDDVWIYDRALTPAQVARLAGQATAYNVPMSALVTNPAVNLNSDGRIDIRDYAVLASKWLETLLWPQQ